MYGYSHPPSSVYGLRSEPLVESVTTQLFNQPKLRNEKSAAFPNPLVSFPSKLLLRYVEFKEQKTT